ncbi:MAG: ATP-binding protein [Desulfuromonadia bacterium]
MKRVGVSLGTKLFVTILVTLSVPFACLYIFSLQRIESFVAGETDRLLAQEISFVTRELSERGEGALSSLSYPASAPPVQEWFRRRDRKQLDDAISRWLSSSETIDRIILFDADNRPFSDTDPSPSATEIERLLPLVRQVHLEGSPLMETDLVYCGRGSLEEGGDPASGRYRLASIAMVPVIDRTGTVRGVIAAIDTLDDDQTFLQGLLPVLGHDVVVGISQQGETIVGTSPLVRGHLPRSTIAQLEQGERAFHTTLREGREYRSISIPLSNRRNELVGAITLSVSREKFAHLSAATRRDITIAFLVGAILSLLTALFISRRLTSPLRQLTEGVHRLEGGSFEGEIQVSTTDEIGSLTDAFNRMVAALRERTRTIETKTAMLVELTEDLERRVAERSRELAEKTILQDQIISAITDGVMVIDASGSVILMNASAATLFGIEPDDHPPPFETLCQQGGFCPIGALLEEVRHHPDRRSTRIEARGKIIDVDLAPIVRNSTVETVVVSLHDVTMEESMDRMKSDFIATVSHELKTPLTSIRGALQFILAKSRWLTGTERELLEICSRNTERLIRLITGILDITQIEQRSIPFHPRPLPPVDLVTDATDALRGMALERNVAVTTVVPPDLPLVRGDHDRLVQVLTNLLSNAINFSDEGKVVRISIRREGGSLLFSVQDMNRTIPESERHKLFRKFQQIDQGEGGRLGGSGLGLAICREIVEMHGGRIWYQPLLAGGNEFIVSLPAGEDADGKRTYPDSR